MAETVSRQALSRLKKQVKRLQQKEERSRIKLNAALQEICKLGVAYRTKLKGKVRTMKKKISHAHHATYAKVAADLERQILKTIESKSKAIAVALAKIENKHVLKLSKVTRNKSKAIKTNKKVKTTKGALKLKKNPKISSFH